MITQPEFDALEARVAQLEHTNREHSNESLAGQFAILRVIVRACADEGLRTGGLEILNALERRLRPLSLRLEQRDARRAIEPVEPPPGYMLLDDSPSAHRADV